MHLLHRFIVCILTGEAFHYSSSVPFVCLSYICVCSFLFMDFSVCVLRCITEMLKNAVSGPHPQELVPV